MRLAPLAALLLAGTAILPVSAQQTAAPARAAAATIPPQVTGRIDKLEREMRAVQRKVFPGASPTYFEPEIKPAEALAPATGTPASTPAADLQARVQALESELAQMTGQIEQNSYKLRQLEEQMTRYRTSSDDRLKTLEGTGPGATPAAVTPPFPSYPTPGATPTAAAIPPKSEPVRSAAPPVKAEAPKPSGDAGEDAYMAGYNLWMAKKYPEAATALKAVVAKYPGHKRASYAQNLIGRAYLDDGKPAMAAEAFYANYQKMPRGERAPDSLYYLGLSLIQLKKSAEACKVYDELQDVYGATLSDSLKPKVAQARKDARCA